MVVVVALGIFVSGEDSGISGGDEGRSCDEGKGGESIGDDRENGSVLSMDEDANNSIIVAGRTKSISVIIIFVTLVEWAYRDGKRGRPKLFN